MTFVAARIEAEIAWLMAHLTAALDDTGPSGEDRPSQAVYPGQAVAALDATLRLRTLDPVAAFHRLEALERVVDRVESRWGSPGTDRTLLEDVAGLFPAFYRALIPGDPAGLAERVFRAVAGTQVVQRGLPADLLAALGRSGREDLVLRIARHRAGPGRLDAMRVARSYVTAVLLAEPDSEHLTRTVLEHGLEYLIFPGEVAERLIVEGRADLQPGYWLELALNRMEDDDDEDSTACSHEALVKRCLAHCEARGLPGLAQEVRWCAFDAFLTAERLRAWLDGVPPGQRAAEEARVLREIVADDDKTESSVLQLLVEWPDLAAAAALVRRRNGDVISYAGYADYDPCRIAAWLEADAPDAALLIYRAVYSLPYPSRVDPDWLLGRCAVLWARVPDGPYESHARFLDGVEERRRRNLALGGADGSGRGETPSPEPSLNEAVSLAAEATTLPGQHRGMTMMPQGFRATACRLRRLFMLMPILASCAAACATAQPVQQPAGSSAAGPVPGAAPELRVVTPDGQVRLSYGGLNTIGPTILDRNLERFIAWPPTFRTLAKDDVRGIRLGMTSAQAGSIAKAIPLVRSEGGEEAGATIWYEDLGRPAPGFMGQPSTPPLACGPDARRQLAMPTPQRLHYRSCLAVRADPGAAGTVGWVSSVQMLDASADAASTLAALVGKYGPPSAQPAGNEMIWFSRDADGSVTAIDALFSDLTGGGASLSSARPQPSFTGKLLDVEMKRFFLPEAPRVVAPRAPRL